MVNQSINVVADFLRGFPKFLPDIPVNYSRTALLIPPTNNCQHLSLESVNLKGEGLFWRWKPHHEIINRFFAILGFQYIVWCGTDKEGRRRRASSNEIGTSRYIDVHLFARILLCDVHNCIYYITKVKGINCSPMDLITELIKIRRQFLSCT